jgi:hypothetical protein
VSQDSLLYYIAAVLFHGESIGIAVLYSGKPNPWYFIIISPLYNTAVRKNSPSCNTVHVHRQVIIYRRIKARRDMNMNMSMHINMNMNMNMNMNVNWNINMNMKMNMNMNMKMNMNMNIT